MKIFLLWNYIFRWIYMGKFSQKFHSYLSKDVQGTILATLAFLTGVITGLYEIIEGELFFATQNEAFGGVMVFLGLITPWIITQYVLKWEKARKLDFAVSLFTLILNILLIVLYIFLPTVFFALIQFPVYAILTMGIGIGCFLLIPKKKWRRGAFYFLLIMGNHLLLLGSYCLIGGILTS